MGRRTARTPAIRVDTTPSGPTTRPRPDTVAVEEPLEIRVDGTPLTTTMRTPGDDFDLALGWLLSERAISQAEDVAAMMHCTDVDESGSPTFNVVEVTLTPGAELAEGVSARRSYTSSACGICGSESIEAVMNADTPDLRASGGDVRVDPEVLCGLVDTMRAHQVGFDRTGGVHAAALFTTDGDLVALREDIGRHNAVDKLVGWAAREGRSLRRDHVLLVSGRAGFELVQKCVLAGVPVMAAVSAPTSLAVDLADRAGLTLVGFLRPPRFTVYSGAERLGVS
ncbi:formate dehydrogenase accessory sulfurtransferase FdhD [Mobilicoccus pelagius]|uniref:Sulfur carrier protein FdhD n=1 Tax=Mobilicoccus pelagius NBRC 104925 TaxID=1089455 RepID=H5UQ09_9MICO|nr:formate dehydrogenase accessory sulfurtransferase FdhD [Mobilicoccus pelagius]GAB47814.1 protein FdhD homolog [Mobilicoccus pelagius NBRC 104925]